MKRLHRWQRILILSLLCLSVFAPIVLISDRLKSISIDGKEEFVEDLSSIKYKADTLILSAVEQEAAGVKEPKQEVYRDQASSIVEDGSDESLKADQSDKDITGTTRLGQKEPEGEDDGFDEKNVQIRTSDVPSTISQQKLLPSMTSKQLEGGTSEKDERTNLPPPTRSHNHNGSGVQKRRAVDERVKQMKDQIIRARAYLSFAMPASNTHLMKELRLRIKEVERTLGDARRDSDLPRNAHSRMRSMEASLVKAGHAYPDCSAMVKKLRAMAQSAGDQVRAHRKQAKFLTLLAGSTTPKGLHCLSMRLTAEYYALPPEEREPFNQLKLYDPDLFHYVVFSDNVLACAVVVNSTVSAAKEPEKIIFHVVTDSLNFPAISMWFLLNPAGKAAVQVQSIDSFKQLSAKYGSIMLPDVSTGKSIDSRFSSPLNHLRFYLPELFPSLDKIVFLDHDVVVLKDLSDLWREDMDGKVNGAVQTCQPAEASNRSMDMLINFSDPWVAQTFDINSCTWAFGMNLFDLREWRNQDLTSKYHSYLLMGNSRPLWKSGSLPLGWVTFYNHTHPLDWRWHVLGLGHEAGPNHDTIQQAAVIHYDGIMKPWSDIGLQRYKGFWTRHINFDHPHLQQCNLHG